jgi:hypothetical protein
MPERRSPVIRAPHGDVMSLLGGYAALLEGIAAGETERPSRLRRHGRSLRRLRPRAVASRFVLRAIRHDLDVLERAYSLRFALSKLNPADEKDRDAISAFRNTLPPPVTRWAWLGLVGAVLVVAQLLFAALTPGLLDVTEKNQPALYDAMLSTTDLSPTDLSRVVDLVLHESYETTAFVIAVVLLAGYAVMRPIAAAEMAAGKVIAGSSQTEPQRDLSDRRAAVFRRLGIAVPPVGRHGSFAKALLPCAALAAVAVQFHGSAAPHVVSSGGGTCTGSAPVSLSGSEDWVTYGHEPIVASELVIFVAAALRLLFLAYKHGSGGTSPSSLAAFTPYETPRWSSMPGMVGRLGAVGALIAALGVSAVLYAHAAPSKQPASARLTLSPVTSRELSRGRLKLTIRCAEPCALDTVTLTGLHLAPDARKLVFPDPYHDFRPRWEGTVVVDPNVRRQLRRALAARPDDPADVAALVVRISDPAGNITHLQVGLGPGFR